MSDEVTVNVEQDVYEVSVSVSENVAPEILINVVEKQYAAPFDIRNTGSALETSENDGVSWNNLVNFSSIIDSGNFGTAAYTDSSAYEVPLTFSSGVSRSSNSITINQSEITGASGGEFGTAAYTSASEYPTLGGNNIFTDSCYFNNVGFGSVNEYNNTASFYYYGASAAAHKAALSIGTDDVQGLNTLLSEKGGLTQSNTWTQNQIFEGNITVSGIEINNAFTANDGVVFSYGAVSKSDHRTALGLEIDNDIQRYSPALSSLSGGSEYVQFTGPLNTLKYFTLPNENATLARTDAAQTFAETQTFNGLVQMTAQPLSPYNSNDALTRRSSLWSRFFNEINFMTMVWVSRTLNGGSMAKGGDSFYIIGSTSSGNGVAGSATGMSALTFGVDTSGYFGRGVFGNSQFPNWTSGTFAKPVHFTCLIRTVASRLDFAKDTVAISFSTVVPADSALATLFPNAGNYVGFSLEPVVGGLSFIMRCRSGTTQQTVSSGLIVAPSSNHIGRFVIQCDNGTINYYRDNVLVGSLTGFATGEVGLLTAQTHVSNAITRTAPGSAVYFGHIMAFIE